MMMRIDIIESIRRDCHENPPLFSELDSLKDEFASACAERERWRDKGISLMDSEFPMELFRRLFRLHFQLELLQPKEQP